MLTENNYGCPDLLVQSAYPNNSVKVVTEGVEIKTTRNRSGAVDTHGARDQWMCVFVYGVDNETEPVRSAVANDVHRSLSYAVTTADFRRNPRDDLDTGTATLNRHGVAKLRERWLYGAETT